MYIRKIPFIYYTISQCNNFFFLHFKFLKTPEFFFKKKMACQLPTECLNEILEYLDEDKLTLYSCLLVNRLLCKIAVRILWRNIWDFKSSSYQKRPFRVASSILSTLFACLSNESKELLHKNEIFISTPTPNSPLFNYSEFCNVLSINEISVIVNVALNKTNMFLVTNEIIKMFINHIFSLKKFTYCYYRYYHLNISLPYIPGAGDLSELCCSSNLPSDFFFKLSQICHNLQSISILFDTDFDDSNELKELISLQNNLNDLTLSSYDGGSWASIIPAIIKHSSTITNLQLYGDYEDLPLSFVSSFTNLRKFILSFKYAADFEDFKKLQYGNFPELEILKIPYQSPNPEYIIKFLENNGKNLKKFHTLQNNKAISLSIANFCPNITSLYVIFNKGEIDILRTIFISCKYLESIKVRCGYYYLNEKEVLNTIVNYSPNNFYELKIYNPSSFDISPEDLESFFINWKNRATKKLLFLIFIDVSINYENLGILEKYKNLDIIKFWSKLFDEEEEEEETDFYCN
jgi:hypothetical protein